MRDRPDGAALLRFARERLLGELKPLLPPEQWREVLRIARAMAIAESELAAGPDPFDESRAALTARYGEQPLDALLRCLAADIHAGVFDAPGAAREEIRRLLWQITLTKLRESNPDYLAAAEACR